MTRLSANTLNSMESPSEKQGNDTSYSSSELNSDTYEKRPSVPTHYPYANDVRTDDSVLTPPNCHGVQLGSTPDAVPNQKTHTMKIYYYIPCDENDASDYRNELLKITNVDYNDVFEFELNPKSVSELARLSAQRGNAFEITRVQYLEAVGEKLFYMAEGNPCRFSDGQFTVSSERYCDMNGYLKEYPHARLGEFESDGEHYYCVTIKF